MIAGLRCCTIRVPRKPFPFYVPPKLRQREMANRTCKPGVMPLLLATFCPVAAARLHWHLLPGGMNQQVGLRKIQISELHTKFLGREKLSNKDHPCMICVGT